ncbi:MAG: hypothetical protein Q9219_002179 [cf. Caloplaca sp. 3 TL-2023]
MAKQHYEKDEKVLCFHGELLYEAKILEVEQDAETKSFRYRIHYKGWKNTWDDWVENDRLRKLNDENREIAQALKRQYLESTQKTTKSTASKRKGLPSDLGSARGSEERNASAPVTGRGLKRGRNADLDEVCSSDFLKSDDKPDDMDSTLDDSELLAIPNRTIDLAGASPAAIITLPEKVFARKGSLTYIGTGLYSPTESLNMILKPVYDAHDRGPVVVVRSVTPPVVSSSSLSELSETPTPPSSSKAESTKKSFSPRNKPKTRVQASRLKPAEEKIATSFRPKKKRRRRFRDYDWNFDDGLEARRKEDEANQRALYQEVQHIIKTAHGNIKVHPDFPHPEAWWDIRQYGTYGYDPVESTTERKVAPKQKQDKSVKKSKNVVVANESGQEESFHNRPMIKIPVPDFIKSLLVDDWEEVTKNLALVPLPATKPANLVIDEYFAEEKEKRFPGSAEMDLLEEVVAGMKEYFDLALGRMLLYRFERQQYLDVRKKWGGEEPWKGISSVGNTYGAEHLCRMIVSLPEIVAQTNMDVQAVNRLREEMTKFLQWLGRNTRTYFTADYQPASQEYIEKVRAL